MDGCLVCKARNALKGVRPIGLAVFDAEFDDWSNACTSWNKFGSYTLMRAARKAVDATGAQNAARVLGCATLPVGKNAWSGFISYGAVLFFAVVLIFGGIFMIIKQSDDSKNTEAVDDTEPSAASAVHLESNFASALANNSEEGPQLPQTPFVCTVGLSLDFFNHTGLLREDGLCDYFIFHSTFVHDAEGRVDLWNGRNYTRAFRTFLAFAHVARKTAYGVAVTHRKSRDALRQLGTEVGVQEFVTYWNYGVRHHAVLDVHESSFSDVGDVRSSFALLKAFKFLQRAHLDNGTLNPANIFLGCSTILYEDSLLHKIIGDELSLLPVDVLILTTHMMATEDSERVVVPPTALRSPVGRHPPAILDVAHHVTEDEYLSRPATVCFTLTMAVLAYDVPWRTRVGAACDKGPMRVPIKEMCRYMNYPQDIKYGNGTVIGRFHSTTKGRLYLFDTKESFRFKMCTLRKLFPEFVHGWAVFDVDLADYDGTCNGAPRSFDRVRAIRETFNEYLKLGQGRSPVQPC
ncbi:hypothetical protein HPB49_018377 [Dermacentor silvarum]|uniref:Uncharacterized protein n=1 Tax=Dermacentor silvarum TaxID=543639 RepID=A0ACB8CZ53_DERSI|nr:hypothetical protein HPB49_018377 [Dermacentor silvarum]